MRNCISRTIGLLNLHDFQVLLAVSELGSFRKASMKLGLGQSTVSRRVQKIEDALGVSLFERNRTGAKLTNAGWRFIDNIRPLNDELNAAVEAAQFAGVGDNGELRIGLIASLSRGALREVMSEFVRQFPRVQMTIIEADRSELMMLLNHRSIDVVHAAGSVVGKPGDVFTLVEEPIYLALPEGHRLATHKQVQWHEIIDESFVVSAQEPGPEISDYLQRKISDLGQRANIRHHRLDREGIMNLVGLGLGISLVAEHWTGVNYPNVVFRRVGDNDERVPFSLTWCPNNDNPALRRFLSLARVHAKAHAVPS